MPHAILIEDDEATRASLTKLLEREGFLVEGTGTLAQARKLLESSQAGVVITDLHLPDGNGIELLREVRNSSSVEVVLITGFASVETAVEALRLGAFDYITKPVDVTHLKRILGNLHRTLRLREEIDTLRGELRGLGRFGQLVGTSPAMQKVYDLLARVGPTDASVLLTGESGTGKELAAMTLHELSQRRDKPFLAVNCGAIASNMIESELFGHERGSFTGAVQKHSGYFERADGGTLFLDEIAEMQLDLQVKLLRVLESGGLVRVGGEREVPVNVRVLAATNQPPETAVAKKTLREDLYYRLKVLQVTLPPLRERGEDVALLAQYFLQGLNQSSGTQKQLTPAALAKLRAYPWPGNVRELKNVVQAAFILANHELGPDVLGLGAETGELEQRAEDSFTPFAEPQAGSIDGNAASPAGSMPASFGLASGPQVGRGVHLPVGTTAAEAERRLILATLEHCGGNKNQAAQMLGVSLKTIYNRLKLYQVAPS
jgi:two-component system, NtrC family, response regulator HydG